MFRSKGKPAYKQIFLNSLIKIIAYNYWSLKNVPSLYTCNVPLPLASSTEQTKDSLFSDTSSAYVNIKKQELKIIDLQESTTCLPPQFT